MTSLVPFIVERLALPSRRVSVVTVCVFSTDVDSFPTNRVTKDWTPVIVWWYAKDTHPSRTEPARTVCVRYGCVDSSKDDEALSAPEEKEMHQNLIDGELVVVLVQSVFQITRNLRKLCGHQTKTAYTYFTMTVLHIGSENELQLIAHVVGDPSLIKMCTK